MPTLRANDGVNLHYETFGSSASKPLILLHGFTGSGRVFERNIPTLSQTYHVIVPDLRGHGESDKPQAGYHVARLAMDLRNLIEALRLQEGGISIIGTSLGAAIIWSYAELFTPSIFSHIVYVDQAPLQNYTSDWAHSHCNKGCNDSASLAQMQHSLISNPREAHLGTIASCLGYRSHPLPGDPAKGSKIWEEDEEFFLEQALKGDGKWYGKLMADHTALDWRDSIRQSFGSGAIKTLVLASERSGCFPSAGPLYVVELAGKGAKGICVDWGGHWLYWEEPEKFNEVVLEFLKG